jgi:hypothetical protein
VTGSPDSAVLRFSLVMPTVYVESASHQFSTHLHGSVRYLKLEAAGRFKKSFTNLNAYISVFRGHVECF